MSTTRGKREGDPNWNPAPPETQNKSSLVLTETKNCCIVKKGKEEEKKKRKRGRETRTGAGNTRRQQKRLQETRRRRRCRRRERMLSQEEDGGKILTSLLNNLSFLSLCVLYRPRNVMITFKASGLSLSLSVSLTSLGAPPSLFL